MFLFCICRTPSHWFTCFTLPRFIMFYFFLPHALVSGFWCQPNWENCTILLSWFYLTSPLMISLFVYLSCDRNTHFSYLTLRWRPFWSELCVHISTFGAPHPNLLYLTCNLLLIHLTNRNTHFWLPHIEEICFAGGNRLHLCITSPMLVLLLKYQSTTLYCLESIFNHLTGNIPVYVTLHIVHVRLCMPN